MAITQAMCNAFKTQILSGGHNFNTTNRALTLNSQDTFKMALYTSSAALDKAITAYGVGGAGSNEVVGSGYSSGGQTLAVAAVQTLSTDTAYVDFDDEVWTTATITARGALIYNSSVFNAAVAVLDFGSDKTSIAGDFTVQFPAAGASAHHHRVRGGRIMPVRSITVTDTTVTLNVRGQERTLELTQLPGGNWSEQKLALAKERINELLAPDIVVDWIVHDGTQLQFQISRVN